MCAATPSPASMGAAPENVAFLSDLLRREKNRPWALRSRLLTCFAEINPAKVASVDQILQDVQDDGIPELQLFVYLCHKYQKLAHSTILREQMHFSLVAGQVVRFFAECAGELHSVPHYPTGPLYNVVDVLRDGRLLCKAVGIAATTLGADSNAGKRYFAAQDNVRRFTSFCVERAGVGDHTTFDGAELHEGKKDDLIIHKLSVISMKLYSHNCVRIAPPPCAVHDSKDTTLKCAFPTVDPSLEIALLRSELPTHAQTSIVYKDWQVSISHAFECPHPTSYAACIMDGLLVFKNAAIWELAGTVVARHLWEWDRVRWTFKRPQKVRSSFSRPGSRGDGSSLELEARTRIALDTPTPLTGGSMFPSVPLSSRLEEATVAHDGIPMLRQNSDDSALNFTYGHHEALAAAQSAGSPSPTVANRTLRSSGEHRGGTRRGSQPLAAPSSVRFADPMVAMIPWQPPAAVPATARPFGTPPQHPAAAPNDLTSRPIPVDRPLPFGGTTTKRSGSATWRTTSRTNNDDSAPSSVRTAASPPTFGNSTAGPVSAAPVMTLEDSFFDAPEDPIETMEFTVTDDASSERTFRIAPRDSKSLVGRGAFGSVFQGIDIDTLRSVAVKVVRLGNDHDLDEDHVEKVRRESHLITKLNHANVIKCLGSSVLDNVCLCIAMEFASGGTLKALVERFSPLPERVCMRIVKEMASALAHVHAAGIVHCDLKLDNVLLRDDGSVAVADFGCAGAISASEGNNFVGTPQYMSPESISRPELSLSPLRDVWALGCCAVQVFTGLVPWSHRFANDVGHIPMLFHIGQGLEIPFEQDVLQRLPPSVRSVVRDCLSIDHERRPQVATVLPLLDL